MADELGLKLSAQVDDWIKSLARAAASADGLLKTVLELERSVKAAFQGIEAAARQGAGKAAGAFVASARVIDEATGRIETDAKNTAKALGGVAVAADKTAKSVAKSADELGKASGGVSRGAAAAASNTTSALAGVDSAFGKISGRLRDGIFSIQSALLGLGAVRFGQAAVESASEFEAALGQLKIVAADSGKPVAELQGFLLDLSKTTPVGLVDLTRSLGDAIGKLPKGANQAALAIDALNAAQAAARASGSSAGQVLDGIIPILNTYGKTGITAAEITDKLFAAFDQGGATVPELSASLGQIVGISSQFGISINELLGEIAVLTRGGQTASEAITNLRQALISTARPPENVQKILKSLNIEFGVAALKSKGLVGVLKDLEDKGATSQIEKLFTDTQGFLGVSTLLGAGLTQVREDIDLIGQSSGKTDQAVEKIATDFNQLAGIAKNRLGAVMIEIGERIIPTVARVLGQLADFAEKNGAAIADGIGKAVEALAAFGAWVVDYGPTILTWFAAFKGVNFFAGLATDIGAAVGALATFNKGFAASQAIGQGMAALGGTAAASFSGGFSNGLKGLGGTIKAAFSSPGILGAAAAAATIGYQIGTALMEALGDALEKNVQDEIIASIESLDRQITARLKALGAKTIGELDEARARIRSGEAVDVGGKGNIKDFKTLAEIDAAGGDVSGETIKGLEAIKAQSARIKDNLNRATLEVEASTAELENYNRVMQAALVVDSADIAATSRARIEAARLGGTVEERERRVAEARAAAADAQSAIDELQKAEKRLISESERVGAKPDGIKPPTVGGKNSPAVKSAKDEQAELEKIAADVAATYEKENAKLEELRLRAIQSGAESAQNEADARRAAFESETDARIDALTIGDAAEKKSAEYRAERERAATALIDDQIAAMERMAKARIEEARSAAAAETKAFAESADIQRGIAEHLARDEAAIQAELAARTEEIRKASVARISAADRAAGAARLAEATRNAQRAIDVERESSIQGRAETLSAGLSNPAQGALMVQGIAGQLGAGAGAAAAAGGAVAVLPAISQALGDLGNLFGGDVEGLSKRARQKESEAASIEKQIAAIDKSEVTRKQQSAATQEKADELRNRADELSAKAREDGISKEEKKRLSDASAALRAQAAKLTRGVEGADAARAAEKQALQERLQALQAESKELRDRAEAARGGLEVFFEDLATNLEKALTGFIVGLPQAIDRILTVAIPALIESIIANLPALFGAAIALLPRIVIALAKAIAFGLPQAIRDGWAQAGKALFEFFTTGVVGAITGGIADAFGAAGTALVDAIVAVFDPIIEFFKDIGDGAGDFAGGLFGQGGEGFGAFAGRTIGTSAIGKIFTGDFGGLGAEDIPLVGGAIGALDDIFHQGGMVNSPSSPHTAAAMAMAGAPRFASGGMVAPIASLARRRLAQVLGGDDVPALLAPGEGVLTARGVEAAGGPIGVESMNRGNEGGAQSAQIVLSTRVGGDAALAAMLTRIVSISVQSASGNVRMAMDQAQRATRVPAFRPVR